MGVIDMIRGRDESRLRHRPAAAADETAAPAPATAPAAHEPEGDGGAPSGGKSAPVTEDESDASSLEEWQVRENEKHPNQPTHEASIGVQKAEAAALVWSKKAVYCVYAWIWVCFFMLALQSSIGNNVIYNAYSGFSSAPLVSTASILGTIIGGVLKLPIAKVINVWGRAEGFTVFVGVYLLGIIVIASCNGPNGYAAGYTLYWIGYDAIYIILDIFIADTSGLRNRAFAFAFASTPFICTAFTGPLAAASFLRMTTWRWAYGAFAIIMPFVFLPLAAVFKFYERKAERMGILKVHNSNRTHWEGFVYYFHEFDVVGALILIAAFVLFLLPFSMSQYGFAQYSSAKFIAMVVIGFCLFPTFYIWERYFARVHFVRWQLFRDRTVMGACGLAMVLYFSFYCWDLYYYYFVMVVYNLSVSDTGYMSQIYNVGSCLWGPIFGIYVRITKHFKYSTLLFAVPLQFLGAGLMIHFRGQEGSINYIIMCQIFIAFAGGQTVIAMQMAVMAAADREGVPMMLSLIALFTSVGGAIGNAVAAAINANIFPSRLLSALPESAKADYLTIYSGGYLVQMTYPVGSPVREAINYAWGQSQRYSCIAATAIYILAIPAILVWKNYRVDRRQNKGAVL